MQTKEGVRKRVHVTPGKDARALKKSSTPKIITHCVTSQVIGTTSFPDI